MERSDINDSEFSEYYIIRFNPVIDINGWALNTLSCLRY